MAVRDTKESYNKYMREYHLKRYYRIRGDLILRLGGKCANCGSIKDLQLDHIDPKTKSFEISRFLSVSKNMLEIEMPKCQVLCSKCHEIKSILDQGKNIAKGTHGTMSAYRYCKCKLCREAKSNYNKQYKSL
jgi:5-methylcytosine-specific restriction endonuclease McrA